MVIPESTRKDSRQSWVYLSFVSVITFFVFGFLDSYGVLLVFLVQHFKEKNSKAAWVGSSAMFGCFFLYPISLRMRYKYGIRKTVLCAGALLVLVFILSPMVPNMALLFLTFSVPMAIACSILSCATFTTIRECFEKHEGVAFGIKSSMNALGTVLFSVFLPILLTKLDWQRTFLILIGISFITFLYALMYNDAGTTEDYRSERICSVSTVISLPTKEFSKNDLKIYWKLLKNKKLLVFLLAHTVFTIVVFMPPIFMVQFATNLGHHLSKSKWLMIVRGIVAVVVRSIAGRLGDVAQRRRKVRYLMLIVMILFSIATILCAFTKSFTWMMVYMSFVSLVDSIYWVVIPLHVSEVTDKSYSEHAFALFSCAGSFATLGGPPFLGWIYDTTGDSSPVMQTASAISAIAACLIALRLYVAKDNDPMSVVISEELVSNDDNVFIDEDFTTSTTVVYMTQHNMQYVTVV
ncbi:monocarboxylate transporter 10-like [Paramuricea clavata]|uniref:Monocarboxylate transporter 10-like n=1 Tax=Paramuricea clavata TaxID=317549 RepID=A0A6S7K4A5_PARCT|nr:monocarboxylate transporter 10-like [Paramuricea clavata]